MKLFGSFRECEVRPVFGVGYISDGGYELKIWCLTIRLRASTNSAIPRNGGSGSVLQVWWSL
jgi:hypothetical protein